MRRYKTVARILLIFSVVNVALATPPVVVREIQQVRVDVVDVTAVSEKRDSNNEEGTAGPDVSTGGSTHYGFDPGSTYESGRYSSASTPPAMLGSNRPSLASFSESSRWPAGPPPSPQEPQPSQPTHPAEPAEPAREKFLSDHLKAKMKDYAVLGLVTGVFDGISNSLSSEIQGTVAPAAYVSASSSLHLSCHGPESQPNILTFMIFPSVRQLGISANF